MKRAKIKEVFESIQGEGIYCGAKQVFVRFFGCNLRCAFCDTPLDAYKEYSVADLKNEILKFKNYHSLCLTGGEPLVQADFLKSFLENIEDLRIKIYLETNGVLFKELASVIREVDIIAMDFKLPSSTKSGDFWQSHEEFLSVASQKEVFVKMVICKETEEADIEKAAGIIKNMKPDIEIVLQPNCFDLSSSLLALMESFRDKFLAAGLKRVKILPQAHKYAGIR